MTTTKSRRVLVTGGSRGIGLECAKQFLQDGDEVTIWALRPEGLRVAKKALEDLGPHLEVQALDIGDKDQVTQALRDSLDGDRLFDVVVNNAGWTETHPFLTETSSYWERVLATNLWGPIHICHGVLPYMVSQQNGVVINVVSDAARVGMAGEAVYSAAKGGLISLTKSLAQEMARHQVRINAISPGPVDTQMLDDNAATPEAQRLIEKMVKKVPLRRVGQPLDIAAAVLFLASDGARYITGQTLSISGGLTMV